MTRIATLALFGAMLAVAQPAHHQLPMRALKSLNLTDAQKAQAKTIFQQARQTAQPLREQMKQNREAMTAAIRSNNPGEIQRLAGLQGNLESQVVANRGQAMAKFYATLTPDQAAQLQQMHAQRKGARQKQ